MKNKEEFGSGIKPIQVDINIIKPYPLNSKEHDEENIIGLMNSITESGLIHPITVDKNMVIIGGHGRLEALKRLDRKVVEVRIMSHLDEKGVALARIGENKTASTDYNSTMLNKEISAAGLTLLDAANMGFAKNEFENLTKVFDEIDPSAFTQDLNADVDQQTKEAENDIKLTDLKLVLVTNGLGFKTVTIDDTRKIARFIATLQEEFDEEDPAKAFMQFVDQMAAV